MLLKMQPLLSICITVAYLSSVYLYPIINILRKIYKLKKSVELLFLSLYFLAWDKLTFQIERTRKRLIKGMKYRSNIELQSSIYYGSMGIRDFDCETQNMFVRQISVFFFHLHTFISHFSISFDIFSHSIKIISLCFHLTLQGFMIKNLVLYKRLGWIKWKRNSNYNFYLFI